MWNHKKTLVVALVIFSAFLTLPVLADGVKGKIANVSPDTNRFTLTENFKNWTFQMDKNGRVFINNQESKLADMKAGDDAQVTFDKLENRFIAREVRCQRK